MRVWSILSTLLLNYRREHTGSSFSVNTCRLRWGLGPRRAPRFSTEDLMSLVPQTANVSRAAERAVRDLYRACHLPEPVVLITRNAVEFARVVATLGRAGAWCRWTQL